MLLKDKVCVVTGAAGVLCSAFVEALLEEGAKVCLLGRTESKLKKLRDSLAQLGFDHTLVMAADVLKKQELEEARIRINEKWGPVEILINGAGGNHPMATASVEQLRGDDPSTGSFFELDTEACSQVFDLNFKGSFLSTQVFGMDMLKHGRGNIINISSMAADRPLTKVGAYSHAKAALDNFTQWLAVHLAKRNIRVNAIAPGFFVTHQNRFLLYQKESKTLTARGMKIVEHTPMGRFGEPSDLKGAVRFLAGTASTFITGITLAVDGGFSAYSGV